MTQQKKQKLTLREILAGLCGDTHNNPHSVFDGVQPKLLSYLPKCVLGIGVLVRDVRWKFKKRVYEKVTSSASIAVAMSCLFAITSSGTELSFS